MKHQPLFCALAIALGLAVASPSMAATKHTKTSQVKALHNLVDKQQQQLDAQQQQIQMLRQSLQRLENQQEMQHQQLEAQAHAAPPPPPAPAPEKPVFSSAPGVSVALHGFVSATAFSQNKDFTFGNGQNAEFPVPGSSGTLSGMDVRNTRFWLDFSGAKFSGNWVGGGRIEMDFFGGYNGSGAYSEQQPYPRLRQAYMTLTNPVSGTTVKIGQQWDLMFPLDNLPGSPTHIAFPLGFGTAYVGWRFPGIVLSQDLGGASSGTKWRLDVGAFEGSWSGPGNNVNYGTAGNAGFNPQLQARLHVNGGDWLAYVSGTYSKNNLSGVAGTAPTPIKNNVTSSGVQVGAGWHPGNWIFKVNAFSGSGMGQLFGNLVQFGDIKENGGFVSAGYKFTPSWTANAFYGYSKSNRQDVIDWTGHGAAGRLKNRQSAVNLEYTAGSYGLGIEYVHDTLDTVNGMGTKSTGGNQINLSALYHF
jgi:hypothetical protein